MRIAACVLAISLLTSSLCLGVGAKSNVEEGLPLTIESPYVIEYLGREFQLVTRYERGHDGEDSLRVEPRLELGIWWNTELSLSAPFLFGEVEPDGVRPIELELTYNLNQETLTLPAIAIAGGIEVPVGEDSNGWDPFIKLLVSRTIGRTWNLHQLHLNALYQYNAQEQADERSGRYVVAVGYSTFINVDTLFLIDVVREQEMEEDVEMNLIEAGVRYQLTPQSVLSTGVGFGVGDESPDVRVTVGYQWEF